MCGCGCGCVFGGGGGVVIILKSSHFLLHFLQTPFEEFLAERFRAYLYGKICSFYHVELEGNKNKNKNKNKIK